MPLSGSTYVAPTWRNGGPPALDAAELQAISDSLAKAGVDVGSLKTTIAAWEPVVSGLQAQGAKIEVGSYVGMGTHGSANPNNLAFSFTPKLVIIYLPRYGLNATRNGYRLSTIWLRGQTTMNVELGGNHSYNTICNLVGNILSWYVDSDGMEHIHTADEWNAAQMNTNETYYWVNIG